MKTLFSILVIFLMALVIFPQTNNLNPKITVNLPLDVELNGLKGKVKKVISEETELKKQSGKFVEMKRQLLKVEDYNENGYYVQVIDYALGFNNTYQFIEGDKTIKALKFQLPNDIKEIRTTITQNITDLSDKPLDLRYDTKFKYKLDKTGRVKEEIIYLSNGNLWLREVYSYDLSGLRNKIIRFEGDGKKSYEQTFSFDVNGVEIENKYNYPEPDEDDSIYSYTNYQFDQKGNWTKRMESNVEIKKSKRITIPYRVAYRTITYYED